MRAADFTLDLHVGTGRRNPRESGSTEIVYGYDWFAVLYLRSTRLLREGQLDSLQLSKEIADCIPNGTGGYGVDYRRLVITLCGRFADGYGLHIGVNPSLSVEKRAPSHILPTKTTHA
jgi:hypothetical protein